MTLNLIDTDISIVGAGFAGCIIAHKLASMNISCTLIDRKDPFPDIFRAEKVEPEQARLLKSLGVFDYLSPSPTPVGTIKLFKKGITSDFDASKQYGFRYSDTVNNLRSLLPVKAKLIVDKIDDIRTSTCTQEIKLSSGKLIKSKLIILASGGNGSLLKSFGLRRRYQASLHSLSFGFDIEKTDGTNFDINGFNYYNESDGVDYLTAFNIGNNTMRVNVFTQWQKDNPSVSAFRENSMQTIEKYFPKLSDHIGEYKIISKVQVFPTSFYRLKNIYQAGMIVVGDELQSVSPATGTGLSKIVTEADRLTEHYIPKWLANECVTSYDVWKYYHDKEKSTMERHSKNAWHYYRNMLNPKYKSFKYKIIDRLNNYYFKL